MNFEEKNLMLKAKSKKQPVETCTHESGHGYHYTIVSELLESNPAALRTSHAMRLSIKAPLPDRNEKPLFGIVCIV